MRRSARCGKIERPARESVSCAAVRSACGERGESLPAGPSAPRSGRGPRRVLGAVETLRSWFAARFPMEPPLE